MDTSSSSEVPVNPEEVRYFLSQLFRKVRKASDRLNVLWEDQRLEDVITQEIIDLGCTLTSLAEQAEKMDADLHKAEPDHDKRKSDEHEQER